MGDKFKRPDVVPTTTVKGEFVCEDSEVHSFFLRLGDMPTIDNLIEVFVTIGRAGRCKACWGDGIARLVSFALQDGMKPDRVARAFRGIQCPAAQVGRFSSCLDWIAQKIDEHERAKSGAIDCGVGAEK